MTEQASKVLDRVELFEAIELEEIRQSRDLHRVPSPLDLFMEVIFLACIASLRGLLGGPSGPAMPT